MLDRNYAVNTNGRVKLKAFFVSDIHETDASKVLENAKAAQTDVIFIGGDLIEAKKPCCAEKMSGSESAYEFLSEAAKLAPTVYALGNHESFISAVKKQRAEDCGAVLLENKAVTVKINGSVLTVGAVGAVTDPDFIREFNEITSYKILICHEPERAINELANVSADLILSGHAHGGQWRFFGRGVYAPGQGLFPKYTRGRYGRLIVSAGVANRVIIPRINNPPETVTLLLD